MKKLSKEQVQRLSKMQDRIDDAHARLHTKLEELAEGIRPLWDHVKDAHDDLQAVYDEAGELVSEVREAQEEFYDGKGEKWQESDAGQQYEDWKSEWECFDVSPADLDEPELPDPDDWACPDERLDELSTEVS